MSDQAYIHNPKRHPVCIGTRTEIGSEYITWQIQFLCKSIGVVDEPRVCTLVLFIVVDFMQV